MTNLISEFDIRIYVEITRFSPSPLAGEGGGEGAYIIHPHLDPPPSRGRIIVRNFDGSRVTNPSCKICLKFGF